MFITPKTALLIAECIKLNRKYVGFRGSPMAPIWFVGEAPGADEDQCGYPFVGYSGKQLDGEIVEAGIEGGICAFTNPYKLRPPDNDIARIEETGILKTTFEAQFFEELNYYKPTFIIPCGATPLALLCPTAVNYEGKTPISKWRGSLLTSPHLSWEHYILPIYHPAFILRDYSERSVNVLVLQRLREEYEYWKTNKHIQPLPSRNLIVTPSSAEVKEYLHDCLAHKGPISCDIELIDRKVPITIAFSYDKTHAISIGWFEYDRRTSVDVWKLIDKVLWETTILGQNFTTFDANWLTAMGHRVCVDRCVDTLVRHHVLHPEMSHKLDFQVMQYTREPYYKEEGRGWRAKEGLSKLMRYNAKDAACTLEVFENQEVEFTEQPTLREFYEYEMELARRLYYVDQRGILVDRERLAELDKNVVQELDDTAIEISKLLQNRPVSYSASHAKGLAEILKIKEDQILNINSTHQLKDLLTNELGIKLKKDRETGKETTNEESLNEAFAGTGNPILKHTLRIRELGKLKGTYIDARLSQDTLYGCSAATGTVTGRRASRQNFLGFGTNLQNQPKHSDLGAKFLACHIARPGRIFIQCDQASAEEWFVQGIIADVSGNDKGIKALEESIRTGISRHAVLASQIFGLPIDRTNDKNCIEYYMGKKTRHAGNYDMQAPKMAAVMASEGFRLELKFCSAILSKFHEVEPEIKGVFHEYIKRTLLRDRALRTPLGRVRVFHGLHPTRDNGKIFREGYAYIPQSSVGDNTGLALVYCEHHSPGLVIQDKHDALLLEIADTFEDIIQARELLLASFKRTFTFENGYSVEVPIDFEIGYSIKGLKKCPDASNQTGWLSTYNTLKQQQSLLKDSTSGQPQPLSVQL